MPPPPPQPPTVSATPPTPPQPPPSSLLSLLPFIAILFFLLTLLVPSLTRKCRRRWTESLRLPPGSMGWPYIGETLRLYAENPNSFFSSRQKRYGKIFKTHLLGCPCVMICSPEVANVVLVTKSDLFKPSYPPSKEKMIGPQGIFFHQGPYHSRLKKLIQSSFQLATIKASISHTEGIVLRIMADWEDRRHNTINALHEMKEYAFEVAVISVFGKNSEVEKEEINHLYQTLEKGYNSMPLNLPGTPFNKAMKARKVLNEILMKLIEKRREKGEDGGGLLGVLLGSSHKLSGSQIADNVIGVIFAAHDTTASVLTWLLKYLHDHPRLLDAVRMEQEEIKKKLVESNSGLTWEDTRDMPLTTRVIQETLRKASILSFTYREAVEDVEMEGYLIPKGWKVLPLFRSIHSSPESFINPDQFDPSRFEVSPQPNTYMPFGKGRHACPGSELAKLEMLVFLHHLTTTFRWEVTREDDGIQYCPFPVPIGGLPIKVFKIKKI